jgi:hypothetical protein
MRSCSAWSWAVDTFWEAHPPFVACHCIELVIGRSEELLLWRIELRVHDLHLASSPHLVLRSLTIKRVA